MGDVDGLIQTPLFAVHERLGAKMAPFAGWAMPLEYQGTVAEHDAVRTEVGVFDVSHLGTVWVRGAGARAAIARAFTNDPGTMADGTSQYTLCCDDDGGILDDLITYRIAEDRFLVIPNAANTATVVLALQEAANAEGAEISDVSRDYAILAVQGPRAPEILGRVFPAVGWKVAYRGVGEIDLPPNEPGWLCRTGYTGEVGAEIVVPAPSAGQIMTELLELGVTPAGLGARDTLRLEMGYPLHGNDIDPSTDPYEAQLGWAVKLDHGPFRGQEALRAKKQAGPSRRLWGLRAVGRGIPRHGMEVLAEGKQVGVVTSGGFSPTLRLGIALAYLDDPLAPGAEVAVDVRGKSLPFEVVRPPFVERDPKG